MCNCLEQANTDRVKSIAFPALGTGSLNFPATESAGIMLDCVARFVKKHTGTSVREITVVVYSGTKDCDQVKKVRQRLVCKV